MSDCPFCGEALEDPQATKCESCGESLVEGAAPPSGGGKTATIVAVVVLVTCMCLCVPIIAAIAIPNLAQPRKRGNEVAAIGALKTISTAQSLFREADKERDGVLDYGTLDELAGGPEAAGGAYGGLIDQVLGSGSKQGYLFRCRPSASTPEFLWMATADPVIPGTTGSRYFAVNQEGIIYYSTTTPFSLNDACAVPAGAIPVGK